MEARLNKENFLDGFKLKRSTKSFLGEDRTEGFMYLHNATVSRLVHGKDIEFGKMDYTKFTMTDLENYIHYFEQVFQPKIDKANKLFKILDNAKSVFSTSKVYY